MTGTDFSTEDNFQCINSVFLSSYNMPKTPPATLLLFGLVSLLCGLKCGTFLFYLMSEWSVLLSDWTPSDRQTPVPSVGFSSHTDGVSHLLQLCDYIHRRIRGRTKLSPSSTSITVTQTARWNIGARLCLKDGGNGASVTVLFYNQNKLKVQLKYLTVSFTYTCTV